MNIQTVKSMLKHLMIMYPEIEAKEMLIDKYPEFEGDILSIDSNEQSVPSNTKSIKKNTRAGSNKNSALTRAKDLYNNSTDKTRSYIIELFESELNLNKNTATTYYYLAAKSAKS